MKNNEKSIINEIYDSKREEYENNIAVKKNRNRKIGLVNRILDEMETCYKGNIPRETKKIIKKWYDEIDCAWIKELEFWQKEFYKLGFIDGMRMCTEVKEQSKSDKV